MVVCNNMEELMQKGGAKLNIKASRVVLEEDGTEVDEDDILMAVQSQTLKLLSNEEQWEPASAPKPSESNTSKENTGSVHPDNTASCLSTEKPLPISPACRSRSDDVTLPRFSTFLSDQLASGQAKAVWSKLIDESAHFFMTKYPDLNSAENYKCIGQKMYASYPSIKHEGNEPWVLAEFCMIICTPLETLQKRSEALLDTVENMTDEWRKGPLQMIDAVFFIEKHTKFDRGKGVKTKSVLTIHEDAADADKPTVTKPLESPHMVIFLHDDKIQQAVVCGDNVKVVFNPTTAIDALLLLIGAYYAFDLEYPKIYSQVMGFIQQYIVGEKYVGITSSKFHQFTTKYVSYQ